MRNMVHRQDANGGIKIHRRIDQSESTRVRRIINILTSTMERGSGSQSRVMRQSGLTYGQNGDILIQELIQIGYLNRIQLKGDRNWVTITEEGKKVVRLWREFYKLIE